MTIEQANCKIFKKKSLAAISGSASSKDVIYGAVKLSKILKIKEQRTADNKMTVNSQRLPSSRTTAKRRRHSRVCFVASSITSCNENNGLFFFFNHRTTTGGLAPPLLAYLYVFAYCTLIRMLFLL